MSDAEVRAAGKTSRPIIGPLFEKLLVAAGRIPPRIWLWALVISLAFITVQIAIREIREEARNIAIAEVAEKHAKEIKEISDKLIANLDSVKKTNAELTKKIDDTTVELVKERAARRTKTAADVLNVRTHVTIPQLSEDVRRFLKIIPESVSDTTMTFGVPAINDFVTTKILYDALVVETEALIHQLGLTNQKLDIVQETQVRTDAALTAAKNTITALETEAAAYKKAAKKSIFRKFLGGAKTVATAVVPALIVYLVMSGK